MVAVLLGLVGCGTAATPPAPDGPPTPAATHRGVPARPPHQLAGALHGRTGARLTVDDAAARVNVRATDLPGLLYRISTPADSGLAPQVTGTPGRLHVGLRSTGDDGADTVDILLNRAVRWQIRLAAGAGEQHLDLSAGRLGALELGAGVGLVRVRLPRPRGTAGIRLTGGVGTAEFVTEPGVPIRIRAFGRSTVLSLPWTRARAVPPGGLRSASPGWSAAEHRYRIDVGGEVGQFIVRPGRSAPGGGAG